MSLSSMTLGRPRPVAFVASLLVAWLLIALIALGLRRGPIESDLEARATEVVRQEVSSSAEVVFEGRDAVVNGTFASAEEAEAARRTAAAVPGAASARLGDDVTIAATPPKPLVVAVEDGALTVTATVPDQRAREDLLGAAVSASSGALAGDVTVNPEAPGPPVAAITGLAQALAAVPGDHGVSVEGTAVVLSGTVSDEAAAERLGSGVLAAAQQMIPAAVLDNRLTVQQDPSSTEPGGAGADGAGTGSAGTGGAESDNAESGGAGTDGAGTDGAGTDGAGTDGAGTDGASAGGAGTDDTATDAAGADGGETDSTGSVAGPAVEQPGDVPPEGEGASAEPTAPGTDRAVPPSSGGAPGDANDVGTVQEQLEAVIGDASVTFAHNSAALALSVESLLDEVAKVLTSDTAADGEVVVEVRGHTDATGSDAVNDQLSSRRAQAVIEYLVAAGVPAQSLRSASFGSTEPVAPNGTVAGRAANRRVELVLVH